MIDEKRLKEIFDWFDAPNCTAGPRGEFREILRLARLGLWAKKHGIPAIKDIAFGRRQEDIGLPDVVMAARFHKIAHNAKEALPKE